MFYDSSTQTEYVSIDAFKLAHKHTSFGDLYNPIYRESINLYTIDELPPEYDSELFDSVAGGVELVNGRWKRIYLQTPKDLTQEQVDSIITSRYEAALTNHLDSVAQSKRYDNRITCALRAGYPGPFQTEGQTFAAWMDECNALAYQMLSDIKTGTRPMFNSVDEFIAELPAINW